MRAVVRLFALYFWGTTSARAFTLVGIVLVAVGCAYSMWIRTVDVSVFQEIPGWLLGALSLSIIPGFIALIFAPALLPSIVGQLSLSRRLKLLPNGHSTLFGSALATIGALALIVALPIVILIFLSAAADGGLAVDSSVLLDMLESFGYLFVAAFIACTIFHVGLWSIGRFKGPIGILTGVILLIVMLALTMQAAVRFGDSPYCLLLAFLGATAALWVIIALAIRHGPSLRRAASRAGAAMRPKASSFGEAVRYSRGHELDLALGTGRPWLFAAGLAVPFGAALWFFDDPTVWSFYLALFAAILGGLAGFAAARTRRLWLRTELDRAALYAQVERAYWRHSAYGLAALAACHAALGLYTGLPAVKMAWGILTLALGTFACLYLGLTMTRGIGWRTAVTTIATMALLMYTASRAAAPDANVAAVAALELALLALAFVFRSVAVKRWSGLDWSHWRTAEAHASA